MKGYTTQHKYSEARRKEIIEKTKSLYPGIKEGWRLQLIVPENSAREIATRYKTQGLEVYIGSLVFDDSRAAILTLDRANHLFAPTNP